MAYDIGQKVRLAVTVKNEAGTPTDATMAVEVRRPDDTLYPAPSIIDDVGVGNYFADVIPDGIHYGPWTYRFTASGSVTGVYSGQFFVRLPGPRIVSLAEAKAHLNKTAAITADDEEIRDWIDATRWVIEKRVGAVVPRTVIDHYDGGGQIITLRQGPILSITEVRESWGLTDIRILSVEPDNGVGLSDNDYTIDTSKRRLLRRSNGWTTRWPVGAGNVRVTYRIGRLPTPDNIRQAAKELVSHNWRASQLAGGGSRPRDGTLDATLSAYMMPNRVAELLGERRAPRLGL